MTGSAKRESSAASVVLFDIGGVLAELGAISELLGAGDDADLWRRWILSESVRAFEKGEISVDTFGAVRSFGVRTRT